MGKLTFSLILINVIIFILIFSMPEVMIESVFTAFSFSFAAKFEVWRWITSLFLHVSASHLFFNMLGLYFFGRILENEIGKKWFLAVYFVAGLLGNFAFMLTNLNTVVGASGAVFGIMGTAMLLNPIKRVNIYVFPLPLGIVAVSFLIFESFVVYFQPSEFSNVANIAHLAGIVTGSIFAFFYNLKRSLEGVLILILCIVLLVVLGPIFSLITGIGSIILQVIETIIGFILYGISKIISFIWL